MMLLLFLVLVYFSSFFSREIRPSYSSFLFISTFIYFFNQFFNPACLLISTFCSLSLFLLIHLLQTVRRRRKTNKHTLHTRDVLHFYLFHVLGVVVRVVLLFWFYIFSIAAHGSIQVPFERSRAYLHRADARWIEDFETLEEKIEKKYKS